MYTIRYLEMQYNVQFKLLEILAKANKNIFHRILRKCN